MAFPCSSTAVSRAKQFDEITDVHFDNVTPPTLTKYSNDAAVFHTFAEIKSPSLKDVLQHSLVEIEFMNLGVERKVMLCTQSNHYIPESERAKPLKRPKVDSKRAVLGGNGDPSTLLKVYAIDRKGWRSIRTNSIINWRVHSTLSVKQSDYTKGKL